MPEAMKKGLRVIHEGRTGTVSADYGADWQTAGVEFDDEPGVYVQKLKTDLTINRAEYEGFGTSGAAYRETAKLRLANIDINRIGDGKMRVRLYDRDDNEVAVLEDHAVKMQEFALRLLQQTTYALDDLTKQR